MIYIYEGDAYLHSDYIRVFFCARRKKQQVLHWRHATTVKVPYAYFRRYQPLYFLAPPLLFYFASYIVTPIFIFDDDYKMSIESMPLKMLRSPPRYLLWRFIAPRRLAGCAGWRAARAA